MQAEEEVDAPVEDKTDAAIAAVTMVIADAIMSHGDQAKDDDVEFWIPILSAGARLVAVQFLLQSVNALFPVNRFPQASAPVVRKHIEDAVDDAIRRSAEILAEAAPGLQEAELGTRAARVASDSGRAARAVVVGGRESSRFAVAQEVGAIYKVWRTRRDKRVRVTHGGLEGNKVPLASEFVTIELNHLRFPRDPLAPLSETAECRCRLSYIVPKGTA